MGGWTAGARYDIRGDVHLHQSAPPDELRFAVWRYRGYEPLPRFLELLRADAEAWGAFRNADGRLSPVVPTVDVARLVGQMVFYWAQEDPRGPSLASRLDQATALSPAFAIDVARQVGAALSEIHAQGLVHGDLDPANVHLAGNLDFVRLAWGGLASRLERAGVDVGRGHGRGLAEVAPEVLLGRTPRVRADVYGLAALTYRMLAGQPAWLVRKNGPLPGVTSEDPLPPLPEWVVSPLPEILAIGLQRDPDRRPSDVADFCDRLAQAARAIADLPDPPGTWAPPHLGDHAEPTPPTVQRTLSPMERLIGPDPALSNAPPVGILGSAGTSTPLPGVRSVVPALARSLTPLPVTTLPPPERTVPPPVPVRRQGPLGPQGAPYALGALMVVGFTAVLAAVLCGGMATTRGPLPVPVPVVVEAVAPPSAPVVTLLSDPSTADVLRDGVSIGHTPMPLPLPSPDDPPVVLEIRKPGYVAQQVTLSADEPPQRVVTLAADAPARVLSLPSARPEPVEPAVEAPVPPPLPDLRQQR
ncbi:MAG: protein kinase [Myxococcota bacterium]